MSWSLWFVVALVVAGAIGCVEQSIKNRRK
jgi:hypothetical protein